jgi:hypothetical protein
LSSAAMFLFVHLAPLARGRSRQSATLWPILPQLHAPNNQGGRRQYGSTAGGSTAVRQGGRRQYGRVAGGSAAVRQQILLE